MDGLHQQTDRIFAQALEALQAIFISRYTADIEVHVVYLSRPQ